MYDYSNSKTYGRADSIFYVLERTAAMKKLLYAHQVTVAVPVTFAKDVLEG